MLSDLVLKKTSALLGAMLTMTAAWSILHLPGADMQMVTFAFLSSAALCCIPDFHLRVKRCIQLICGAVSTQFTLGITANYPLIKVILSALVFFIILVKMPDRQIAVISLLSGCLALFAPAGVTISLNRCLDIVFSGTVVMVITTLSNIFVTDKTPSLLPERPYTPRMAAIITAELTTGFIIFQAFKHEQMAWILLTVLFIHMAATPQKGISVLVKQRIAATPAGILLGGLYLAAFSNSNYRMIYIVPFTGTLSFFILYQKNNYFHFTLLFMFTLTLFTDWMLGSGNRFHFTEIMFSRSLAAVIGGILLLCGKNFMQKETVS